MAGLGYIGAQLAADLLEAGERVVGVDNLFATDSRAIARLRKWHSFSFVRGSIASRQTLARAFGAAPIDFVFALAAQASAHPEAASPRYTETTNLLAPRLLLEAAVAHGARAVVYGSSFRVYGDTPPAQAREDSPYGRFGDLSHLSKVYVEKLMEMYAFACGLRCVAVRLGLVYGVGPVMKSDYRFLTAPNKFCLQAVRGETLVVGESGLKATALLHVADASRALRQALALPEPPTYLAVNAATEVANMLDVARLVANAAKQHGLSVAIAVPASPPAAERGEVPSRLREVGFRPTRSLAEGIAETLAYYQRVTQTRRRP